MIKINLLPTRKRERKALNVDLYILLGVLVVSCALIGGFYLSNHREINRLQTDLAGLKQQSALLQSVRTEFASLEKDKKEISNRLAVINKMSEGRALAPRMLYDLSALVKNNMWLKRFRKDETRIEVDGRSLDNESICEFVERLSKLPYVKSVDLKSVEDTSEGGITVKKFLIEGTVES